MSLCLNALTRDASPPLVLAFGACVWCLRLVLAFDGSETFTILQKLYLPSILHLTLIRYNLLVINALLSVRYCKFHLHTTYTQPTHPTCYHTVQAREENITV